MTDFRKSLLLVPLALFVLVAAGLWIAYAQRARMAQLMLDRALAGADFAEAKVSVNRVGFGSAELTDLMLAGDFWRAEAESVRVSYDWWRRQILGVEISRARVAIDLDAALATPSVQTLDELADRVEAFRRALPEVPFSLQTTEIMVRFGGENVTVQLAGSGRLHPEPLIEGDFRISVAEWLAGDLRLSRHDRSDPLRLGGHLRTTGNLALQVERWLPDRLRILEDQIRFDWPRAGTVEVDFWLEEDRLRLAGLELDAAVLDAGVTAYGVGLDFDALNAAMNWKPGMNPVFSVELTGARYQAEGYRGAIDRILANGVLGETLSIEGRSVLFDSEFARGRMDLSLSTPWPEGISLLNGASLAVTFSDVQTDGIGWEPIRIDARIHENEVIADLPRVASLNPVWPLLDHLRVRAPLDAAGIGAISAAAQLVFPVQSADPLIGVTGSALQVSGTVSGIATDAMTIGLRADTAAVGGSWEIPRLGGFDTQGWLEATVQMSRPDLMEVSLRADLESTAIRSRTWNMALAGVDLGVVLPPRSRESLVELRTALPARLLAEADQTDLTLVVVGDRLEVPGVVLAEWFDIDIQLGDPDPQEGQPADRLSFDAGNLRIGQETLNQVQLRHELVVDGPVVSGSGRLEALFEGVPLGLSLIDEIRIGSEGNLESLSGGASLDPLQLQYSDLLSRHLPRFPGLSLSATLEGTVQGRWAPDEPWDAGGRMTIRDGAVFYPAQNLRIEGLAGVLAIDSFRSLQTPLDLVWTFDRLALTDLELIDGRLVFGLVTPDRLAVSELSFEAFKGRFRLDPFVYSIPNQSAELAVRVDGLDAGAVVDHLNFFDGRFVGTLNGSVPFRIRQGRVDPLQGHLELDDSVPASFHYDADGLLTRGEQARSFQDRLRLLPLEMVEEGLGDLRVESLTVDLFDPQWPDRPIRIHLSGEANTAEAVIPYDITTNVNGTVAEVLNFLFRLSSL